MLGELPKLKKVYRLDPLAAGQHDRDPGKRLGAFASAVGEPVPAATNPDLIVYLAYTSGTTGRPKGVMHSDNTILANSRAMVRDWRFDQEIVVYSFSPLSHNMGRYRRLVNAGAALPLQRAVIDEVQRAPQLLLAIKRAVDTDRRPGRFLLSGSADLMTLPSVGAPLRAFADLREMCRTEFPLPSVPADARRGADTSGTPNCTCPGTRTP